MKFRKSKGSDRGEPRPECTNPSVDSPEPIPGSPSVKVPVAVELEPGDVEDVSALSVLSDPGRTQETPSTKKDRAGASQAGPPPPPLPLVVHGRWLRDWRLGSEMVTRGAIGIERDAVTVTGRRSSPLRSIFYLGFWLLLWAGVLAFAAASLLTSLGLAVRTEQLNWLMRGPCFSLVVLILGVGILTWLGRKVLQPNTRLKVPWDQVHRIASDGKFIQVEIRAPSRRILGRIKPKATLTNRRLLGAIRAGNLPHGAGAVSMRRLRPVWVDRLVLIALFAGATWGAWSGYGPVSTWWDGRHEPSSGPLAGNPVWHERDELKRQMLSACVGGDPNAPKVTNRRDGDALVWDSQGDLTGYALAHLKWEALTETTELITVDREPNRRGRLDEFFTTDDVIGISAVVSDRHIDSVEPNLRQGLLGYRLVTCGGQIASVDVTRSPTQTRAPEVLAERDGADLIVKLESPEPGYAILPVRRRPLGGPALLDACEVPLEGSEVGLLSARTERRIHAFFHEADEGADVYIVPESRRHLVERLGRDDDARACMVVESLDHAGIAAASTSVAADPGDPLKVQATAWTHQHPPIPVGSTPAIVVDKITERYAALIAEFEGRAHTRQDWAAVNQGFLEGIDWVRLFDVISFRDGIPLMEMTRQRMSGADPNQSAGEQLLLQLADEFLARIPPERSQFESRYQVGMAWFEVDSGTTWTVGEVLVSIPDERTADYYQLIGQFVLIDLGLRMEEAINRGDISTAEVAELREKLEPNGIVLDIERSSSSKALEAWATGNFEYLGDRMLAKSEQIVNDEQSAVQKASAASYSLRDEWTGTGGAVRYATVLQDGRGLGWVALFDASRIRVEFLPVNGDSATAASVTSDPKRLLATSGSYVNADSRTAGLAVVGGVVENYLISPRMEGLVYFTSDGEMGILDMRNGGTLPGQSSNIRPLKSLRDLHTLLAWLDREGGSAFQTHLLAHAGQLTIDEAKAKPDLRERRLLVQASYKGNPIVCLVDIPGRNRQSLFRAALVTAQALSTPNENGGPGLTVEAIANLDVGSFDVLKAWSDTGNEQYSGPLPISRAMNLVTVKLR